MTYDYEDTSDEPTITEQVKPVEQKATLPFRVAKAMQNIVTGKHARHAGDALKQVLCESNDQGQARYVATNGNVMLIIDTDLPGPCKPAVFTTYKRWNEDGTVELPGMVQQVIESKGHAPVVGQDHDCAMYRFPDYKLIGLSGEGSVGQVGFNSAYLKLIDNVNFGLKLGTNAMWSVRFTNDALSPTVWAPRDVGPLTPHEVDGFNVTSVQFVIMPVRLG